RAEVVCQREQCNAHTVTVTRAWCVEQVVACLKARLSAAVTFAKPARNAWAPAGVWPLMRWIVRTGQRVEAILNASQAGVVCLRKLLHATATLRVTASPDQ